MHEHVVDSGPGSAPPLQENDEDSDVARRRDDHEHGQGHNREHVPIVKLHVNGELGGVGLSHAAGGPHGELGVDQRGMQTRCQVFLKETAIRCEISIVCLKQCTTRVVNKGTLIVGELPI